MTASLRTSGASGASDSQTNPRVVTKPAGTLTDDVVVVTIEFWSATNAAPTVDWASQGFTEIAAVGPISGGGGFISMRSGRKAIPAGEGGSWSFAITGGSGVWNMAHVAVGQGIDTTSPVDAVNTATAASGTAEPAPTVNATNADLLLHFVQRANGGSQTTAPTNYTMAQNGNVLTTNYRVLTGAADVTPSGGVSSVDTAQTAIHIALKPAGAATNNGAIAATIPELAAVFGGSALASGLLSAPLPMLESDVSASAMSSGSMQSILPSPSADFDGSYLASGTLTAVLPDLNVQLGQANESGFIAIILPRMIMGANTRGAWEMETQRKLTREFIMAAPITIALIPGIELRKPSGGIEMKDGVPRPLQTFRLIPMSHTERPRQSSSAAAAADAGVQRRYDYTLLGEWDSVMRENDFWITDDGQKLVIEALVSYNGYQRKGLVISYGRVPEHVSA